MEWNDLRATPDRNYSHQFIAVHRPRRSSCLHAGKVSSYVPPKYWTTVKCKNRLYIPPREQTTERLIEVQKVISCFCCHCTVLRYCLPFEGAKSLFLTIHNCRVLARAFINRKRFFHAITLTTHQLSAGKERIKHTELHPHCVCERAFSAFSEIYHYIPYPVEIQFEIKLNCIWKHEEAKSATKTFWH